MLRSIGWSLLCVVLCVRGASGQTAWPEEDWETATPVSQGMDADGLQKARAWLESHNSKSGLVIRHGRIVAEWYFGGADRNSQFAAYSTSKSLSSMASGIAIADGKLALDHTVGKYLSEASPETKRDVTVKQLLSMTSGVHNDSGIGQREDLLDLIVIRQSDVAPAPGPIVEYFQLVCAAIAQDEPAKSKAESKEKEPAKNKAAAKSDAKPRPKTPPGPPPTVADVPYGDHARHKLDFYKAESDKPTPLLFFIHGGGWTSGDKGRVGSLADYLKAGVSVVSINYRYVTQAQEAGIKPPVQWPLHDAARALQFVRSKAGEWNIDKTRIGASGGSAGACSSLWLAFHDDLADPKSSDPIARESTRLLCAGVIGAQTTLDPQQMKEWTPNSRYGGHAFGFMTDPKNRDGQFAQFLAGREQVLPWIKEYSPYEWVSSDDPPIYLTYSAPPALGQEQSDPTHSANFGVKLQERLREAKVACELVYPGAPDVKHAQPHLFLIATLAGAAVGKSDPK